MFVIQVYGGQVAVATEELQSLSSGMADADQAEVALERSDAGPSADAPGSKQADAIALASPEVEQPSDLKPAAAQEVAQEVAADADIDAIMMELAAAQEEPRGSEPAEAQELAADAGKDAITVESPAVEEPHTQS